METRLNSAVIGCGRMGAFTSENVRRFAPACWFPLSHAEAIGAHPRLHLQALCDADSSMLQRAAQTYGTAKTYTDAARMLDEIRPALAGIATRTIGRAGLITQAVANGTRALHVEKPLCNSISELETLRGTLERSDVFITYGTVRRFFPVYRQARDLAESGRFGALREIRVGLGSAPLYWTHPHSIDLILFAGHDRRVTAVQARLGELAAGANRTEIESDPRVISASIYFDDGVAGHISQALGADLTLSCAEAEIVVRADGAFLEIYAASKGCAYPSLAAYNGPRSTDGPGGTLAPISQLVACLDGDSLAIEQNAVVKRDILAGQEIAFSMIQSHIEGSRLITPGDVDRSMFIHARTGGRHA